MNAIRWGLVSTARINRKVIPGIRASARGELFAVASRSQETADAYAREWEIPRAFGSYQAMLESDDVDAVYISLPNHLHCPWTIRALDCGKHVLCEKPMALTVEELDSMRAAAHRNDRVLAEALMYRYHPQARIVETWVREGRLGEITLVRGAFSFLIEPGSGFRLTPELGGGCLWDVGVYPLSLAQWVMGEKPMHVKGEQRLGQSQVDMAFAGQLYYEGGRMGQIYAAFCNPRYTSAEIIGTEGRLILNRPFIELNDGTAEVLIFPAQGEAYEVPVPDEYLYTSEFNDMNAAILDGQTPYWTLAETRDLLETVLALRESAQTGRVISLNQVGSYH